MSFVGTAVIAAGAIGAGASIYSANKAAGAQSQALSNAASTIQAGQQSSIDTLIKWLGPYAKFGGALRPTLESLLTPGPSQTETLSQLPGFQFARDMAGYGVAAGAGRTGISGTTAVKGGNLESALASQYFSNFTDPLINLYGTGQNAASSLGQGIAGIQTGGAQSLANLAVGQGNVQAGLYGAIGGAAGNFGSSIGNAALLSKLTGGGLFGGQQAPVDLGYAVYNNGQPIGIRGVGPFAPQYG